MSERPWLVERAGATPNAPALSSLVHDFTWSELEAEARTIEAALARQGVLPSGHIDARLGQDDLQGHVAAQDLALLDQG